MPIWMAIAGPTGATARTPDEGGISVLVAVAEQAMKAVGFAESVSYRNLTKIE